jgi:hypothetical protein
MRERERSLCRIGRGLRWHEDVLYDVAIVSTQCGSHLHLDVSSRPSAQERREAQSYNLLFW